MNPRLRRDWCLKPAPWTARPSNLAACGCARTLFAKCCKSTKCNSPTGIRTRVVWVKTTYPDQLDYWGFAPAGNQTRVSSVAGTYTITVLPAHAAHHVAEVYFYFFIFVVPKQKRKYTCRDSNSGFPACEAGVMTRLDHTCTRIRVVAQNFLAQRFATRADLERKFARLYSSVGRACA